MKTYLVLAENENNLPDQHGNGASCSKLKCLQEVEAKESSETEKFKVKSQVRIKDIPEVKGYCLLVWSTFDAPYGQCKGHLRPVLEVELHGLVRREILLYSLIYQHHP